MKQDYSLRACLLKYLKRSHTGHINAIPSRILEVRFSVCGSTIRRAVLALRRKGEPICSCPDGYFYAADVPELEGTIQQFKRRLYGAASVKKSLSRTMRAMPGTGQQIL